MLLPLRHMQGEEDGFVCFQYYHYILTESVSSYIDKDSYEYQHCCVHSTFRTSLSP